MTPEERALAAIESAWGPMVDGDGGGWYDHDLEVAVAKAIREAVAEEREACARIAESLAESILLPDNLALALADKIRARGKL